MHRIARRTVEIVAADRAIAERLAGDVAHLAPAIAAVLGHALDAADDGRVRRIDRLELILPPCTAATFGDDLLAGLTPTLGRAIGSFAPVDPIEDALDLLVAFAGSGVLPWWAAGKETVTQAAALLAASGGERVGSGLRYVLGMPDAVERLARALGSAALASVVRAAGGEVEARPGGRATLRAAEDHAAARPSGRPGSAITTSPAAASPRVSADRRHDAGALSGIGDGPARFAGARRDDSEADRLATPAAGAMDPADRLGFGDDRLPSRPDKAAPAGARPGGNAPDLSAPRASPAGLGLGLPTASSGRSPRSSSMPAGAEDLGEAADPSSSSRPVIDAGPPPGHGPAPGAPGAPGLTARSRWAGLVDRDVRNAPASGHRKVVRHEQTWNDVLPAGEARPTAPQPFDPRRHAAMGNQIAARAPAPVMPETGAITHPDRTPAEATNGSVASERRSPLQATSPPMAREREAARSRHRGGDGSRPSPPQQTGIAPPAISHNATSLTGEATSGRDRSSAVQVSENAHRIGSADAAEAVSMGDAVTGRSGGVTADATETTAMAPVRAARPDRTPPPTDPRSEPRSASVHDAIHLDHAGIVMLWPFFPSGFAKAGLWNVERGFVDAKAAHRAAAMIDHLVSGDRDPPEHRLPLAKLLVGLPVDALHMPGGPLTEAEVAAGDAMLGDALAALPMLGRIGVRGLRDAWLARPGRLAVEHGGWMVRVERRSYDLLLDRLPWPVQEIAMPWVPEPLHVWW